MSVRPNSLIITTNIFGAFFMLMISAFFLGSKPANAKEWEVFIHRVQIAGSSVDEDFIEIRNDEDCAIDLSGWKLRKRTASGTESSIKVFDDASLLPRGKTFLWAHSKNAFASSIGAHQTSTATLSANNAIGLFDGNGTLRDSLSWGIVTIPFRADEPVVPNPMTNESLVRTAHHTRATIEATTLPSGDSFDTTAVDVCGVSTDRATTSDIIISEVLANPGGDEASGEFIELENRSTATIDLSGWKLRDASKTGKYVFPEGSALTSHDFLTLYRSTFVFALNNGAETVSLEDPKGSKADSVSWQKTRENISLARDGARWRNTKSLTPGTKNRFGNDPTAKTRVPKEGFVGIPLSFSASTKDKDREKTNVVWDFGDGHKSYQKDPTHTFTKKKRFTVKLTYTDGVTNKTKKFRVDIKTYHAPKIRIRSLTPNPDGADTNREFILIENRSKKSVDLKGWIIATKSKRSAKNFVNHAITTNIILRPGESTRLTHAESAFILGNTRQYIELRDPRKKTVQSLRYRLEKSAPENAEFFKEPNQPWQWRQPIPLDTIIMEV